MIRALALVMLLAGFVKGPAGWREDVEQATSLAAKTNAVPQLGGAPAIATAQVYVPPDGGGGLYVIAVAGKVTEHRDAAARVAVDSFLGTARRAQLTSDKVSVAESASRIDTASKQIEATLQWQYDGETTIHARLLIAADAENIVAVTAECVLGNASPAAAREACTKALATLDPGIAPARRIALALAPEGSAPPPPPGADRPAPTMSDGSRAPLPPISLPQPEIKRTMDRRPVYVGLGIVLLAALFWWNRRHRDRFAAKDNDE